MRSTLCYFRHAPCALHSEFFMTDVIISVEHLSKEYRLGEIGADSLREAAERFWHRLRGRDPEVEMGEVGGAKKLSGCPVVELPGSRENPTTNNKQPSTSSSSTLWALKDVSFEVKRGEVLGIIGRNGAGKSTLLKILSRITEPTSGRAVMRGRVGSLLEVGTGFHPELTGRENVFLNGAILGMRKKEIENKFDEIVAFAEVEKFIDTPVKRYSSGMYVRLAFAVAAHLDPEILIVDEVLAVGDAAFQKKCLGKMGDVSTKEGRTVLFVSHNMAAINKLCGRVLWIDQGQFKMMGISSEVTPLYLMAGSSLDGVVVWKTGLANQGVEDLKLFSVAIIDDDGKNVADLNSESAFAIAFDYELYERVPCLRMGYYISTQDGMVVFESYDSDQAEFGGPREPGRYCIRCKIPGRLLAPGAYTVSLNAGIPGVRNLLTVEAALVFCIHETGMIGVSVTAKRAGIIRPKLEWICNEQQMLVNN